MLKTSRMQTGLRRITAIILPFLGLLIITALVAGMWWWEVDGRQRVLYEDAVVFKEDIKRGTIVTIDMLTTLKVERDKKIGRAIIDKNEIIGLESKQFIPSKAQLDPQFFDNPDLITGSGKGDIRIPNEWIYSMPNTLRRKDYISFYEVPADVMQVGNTASTKIRIDPNQTPATGTGSVTSKPDGQLQAIGKDPILKTIVNYVKDGANREVVSTSSEERIDGSSVIKDVEIVGTPDDLNKLEEAIRRGSKFIVMYSDGEVAKK